METLISNLLLAFIAQNSFKHRYIGSLLLLIPEILYDYSHSLYTISILMPELCFLCFSTNDNNLFLGYKVIKTISRTDLILVFLNALSG